MRFLQNLNDRFFGGGAYSVSVPPMDGAFRPNNRIEEAKALYKGYNLGGLVEFGNQILVADGPDIIDISKGSGKKIGASCPADILAMAVVGDNLALVTADGVLLLGAPEALVPQSLPNDIPLAHTTAITADRNNRNDLIIAIGSKTTSPDNWTRDLLERRSTGMIWRVSLSDGQSQAKFKRLASHLAWPAGILVRGDEIFVSEAWRHRIIKITPGKKIQSVLGHLPGYPGALQEDQTGGAVLSVFAPRSQLIEFVLRQPVYRERMMMEVPKHLWVAPAYASGKSFLEPLQGGAVKQMGILKPWAPTRSYGLAARLDENFYPVESFHSRADGKRHGIVSAIMRDCEMLMVSRGSGEVIAAEAREAKS